MKLSFKDRVTSPYFIAYALIGIFLALLFWLTDSPGGEGWKFLIILFYIPLGSGIAHMLTLKRVQNKGKE